MKKSNEVLRNVTRLFEISSNLLIIVGFVFSLTVLFAVGGLWADLMSKIAVNIFPVFLFAILMYLYMGYSKWSLVHFEHLFSLRYGVFGILCILFLFAL
jgi:hypothetical protein